MKQVTRQFPMQAAKNIFWDMIIAEATKLKSYLNYILDKEIVMQASR